MIIKNASVFQESGTFKADDIFISGAYFADDTHEVEILDASDCVAIPGLIDVHIHGCVGYDFSTADATGLLEMTRYQAQNGVTAVCATTLTLPEIQLAEACRRIAAHDDPNGAAIAGIYLEGPFLSGKKAGAQNPDYLQKPDIMEIRRLQEAANGLIKLIALAPELEGAIELIGMLRGEITCVLGHTTANYDLAQQAFVSGARQVAHLYNAMPPFHHREPGVIGAAMDAPDCRVELICDCIHIHPSVVRATMRMFGDDRVIFVSDGIMATGLDDGCYELGGLAVAVSGRHSYLAGSETIAGSVTNLMDCLKIAVSEMGIPLGSVVKCATVNPAKALGVFDQRGSIKPGKCADLVLLNEDLSIRAVFLRGSRIV
ncbi:MAG: N-acetylglucosamine-6-phosphate deacetylase [Oscillospiraceae bacterium]|nr:N-acetylglucosamine-6-phosphate deacetylase [Oscillospiraceae bacterium]